MGPARLQHISRSLRKSRSRRGAEWADDRLEVWRSVKEQGANIRLCIDGARHGSGVGAGGIAILAHQRGERYLLDRAGRPVGILKSAFLAEALALEWGLEQFRKLWKRA